MKFLLFVLLFVNFIAYGQNPVNETYKGEEDGDHMDYYFDGGDRCKYTIKNGNLQGVRLFFHRNGSLAGLEQFDQGEYHGINLGFTENGDSLFVEQYAHDTLLYTRNLQYYKDGTLKLVSVVHYVRDSSLTKNPFRTTKGIGKIGISLKATEKTFHNYGYIEEYDTSGALTRTCDFLNGEYTGTYREFYASGAVMTEAQVVDFKFEGPQTEYFENGFVKSQATYVNDKLHGNYTEYDEFGELMIDCNYDHGKLVKK